MAAEAFSGFEWYLLGSWFYPIAAITAHVRMNGRRIASEIFSVDGLKTVQELFLNHSVYRAPTYVGGPHAMMPFGGGISNEWRRVYSAFRSDCGKLYWNYELMLGPRTSIPYTTTYISKEADLAAVVPAAEHNRFPLSFPIQMRHYSLPGGPIFFHRDTGLAGLAKKELLQHALFQTRFFGTVGIPSAALLMFIIPWGFYKMEKSMFPITFKYKSPPTNIIAKIQQRLKL